MARDHGRVLCKIWQDKDFRALPRTTQCLYIQLLSQPNVNNAGVLPLMLSKWAKGCDELAGSDALLEDLAILVDREFIVVDTDSEEVLVRSFIRNDGGMAHKYIFKNALTCAEAVESEKIRKVLAAELRRIRGAEARRVAEILDPSEPDQEAVQTDSESLPNVEVIPSESHSDPIAIPSESGMAFESHSNHCGVGEGEGVGGSYVVGHLGGVAQAPTHNAHTREEAPQPQPNSEIGELPDPWCSQHPGGTSEPCRTCKTERTRHERAAAEAPRRAALAESERARRAAEDRAQAIANCTLCNDAGFVGGVYGRTAGTKCDHDPGTADRARRHSEQIRTNLAAKKAPSPSPEEIAKIRAELDSMPPEPDSDDAPPETARSVSVPPSRPEPTPEDESLTTQENEIHA